MAFVDRGRTNMKIELAGDYRVHYLGMRGAELMGVAAQYSYQADWKLMSRECQLATMLEF